jgi:two-component system, OmpR family, response regulator ChvI
VTYGREDDDDELRFSDEPIDCCVSIVDMVGSTRITANIGASHKMAKYYSIFINNMSVIGKKFGALITKIAGDSLVLYFPQTSNKNDKRAFKNVIECGITMLAAFDFINSKMSEEGLPSVGYRISSDYGRSDIGRSHRSNTYDLFGSTMNICAEINRIATPNTMVVGGNLYQIIKSFPSFLEDYLCKLAGEHSVDDLNRAYPVYSVASKYTQLRQVQLMKDTKSINKPKEKVSLIRNSTHSVNILLVDDDSDILLTYKTFLEDESYKVDTFSNSEDALKHFSQCDASYYDLVLLDIRMPRLNGLQLFYRMKSIEMDTKIIFVSALDAADELLSMLPGIKSDRHIIKKPIGKEPFLEKIKVMISETS